MDVSFRCLEIILEISAAGCYVTFEMVIQVLFERFNISCFQDIGINSYHDVPVLAALDEIQSKVSSYVQIYFLNETSSVKSLVDLEIQLVVMLQSFCIPVLMSFGISKAQDPNEIDIEQQEPHTVAVTFEDYGVGPLHLNPILLQYLFIPPSCSREKYISSGEVLRELLQFVTSQGIRRSSSIVCDIKAFELFLLERYSITSLQEIGIMFSGTFARELLMASHVCATNDRILIDEQKNFLNEVLKIHSSQPATSSSTSSKPHWNEENQIQESSSGKNMAWSLQPPMRASVASFLDECTSMLDRKRASSPYPPSFAQMHGVVATVLSELTAVGGEISNPTSKKRQRKRRNLREEEEEVLALPIEHFPAMSSGKSVLKRSSVSSDNEQTPLTESNKNRRREQVAEVLTEYLMLHIGGKKYLRKRLVGTDELDEDVPTEDRTSGEVAPSIQRSVHRSEEVDLTEVNSEGGSDGDSDELRGRETFSVVSSSDTAAPTVAHSVDECGVAGTSVVIDHGEIVDSIDTDSNSAAAPKLDTDLHITSTSARTSQNDRTPIEMVASVIADCSTTAASQTVHSVHTHRAFPPQAPPLDSIPPTAVAAKQASQTSPPSTFEAKIATPRTTKCSPDEVFVASLLPRDLVASLDTKPGLIELPTALLAPLAPWAHSKAPLTDNKSVGRWGEALVYQYLLYQTRGTGSVVQWLNEVEETRASYDIMLTRPVAGGRHIVVYVSALLHCTPRCVRYACENLCINDTILQYDRYFLVDIDFNMYLKYSLDIIWMQYI